MIPMDSNHSVHSLDEQRVQLGGRQKKILGRNGEDGIFNRLNKTKRREELGE